MSTGRSASNEASVPANFHPQAEAQPAQAPDNFVSANLCHFPLELEMYMHLAMGAFTTAALHSASTSATCKLSVTGAKKGGAGRARAREEDEGAEEEDPEGHCGSEARARRRSSKDRCRAARDAQDAESSKGTSRMYESTEVEPQRPKSWMAHTSSPALANP